jgi:hypothetical protein
MPGRNLSQSNKLAEGITECGNVCGTPRHALARQIVSCVRRKRAVNEVDESEVNIDP